MLVAAEGGWAFHGAYPSEMKYTVIFDKATVEYSSRSTPAVKVYSSGGKVETPPIPEVSAYAAEINYFLDCIVKNQKPKTLTPKDARNAVLLVKAEEKSARDHRNVAITV